jgi:signal transduction histidine kinase
MKYILLFTILFFYSCEYPNQKNKLPTYFEKMVDSSFTKRQRSDFADSSFNFILKDKGIWNKESLHDIIVTYYEVRNLDKFFAASKLFYRLALADNNDHDIGSSYFFFSKYYKSKIQYDSTYYYLAKSEKIFLKLHLNERLAYIYEDKASIQFFLGDFFGAENTCIKALNIKNPLLSTQQKFDFNSLLGSISVGLEDYKAGLEYQFKAFHLIEKRKDNEVNLGIVLNNIGNIYEEKQYYKTAINYYNQALLDNKLCYELPELYARLLDNLGYCRFKLTSRNALPLLLKSYKIRSNLNLKQDIVISEMHLADYHIAMKDTLAALSIAKKSLISAQKNNFKQISDVLIFLMKYDKKNFQKYLSEYLAISNKVQLDERKIRNKFGRIEYETDEIAQQKDIAQKQRWILAVSLIFATVLLTLLILILYYRLNQKKLLLRQQQQLANEDIYNLLLNQQMKIEEVRNAEKKRIARELHDGIMNQLTSTRLNLFVLNVKKDKDTIEHCLPYISRIQIIEQEIRSISYNLNQSSTILEQNFRLAIEELINYQKSDFMTYHLEIDDTINWEKIDTPKKVHIYRVLQEALQNINIHSSAKNAVISFRNNEVDIVIKISDDGVGFYPKDLKKGMGLFNMKSRAAEIEGQMEIDSNEGQGTRITLYIKY